MGQLLKLHPDSRSAAVTSIEVEATRPTAGTLALSYRVTGTIGSIRLPSIADSIRTDDLWRHTCFEAFMRAPAGTGYYEFNFSPSTQWAAYRFGGYRAGMAVATEIAALAVEAVGSTSEHLEFRAALDLNRCPDLASHDVWWLGLAAVIEDINGGKSYWALAHPPGKPDFHHPDAFVYEISRGTRS